MGKQKYTLLNYAQDILLTAKRPMTYQEIWEFGKGTEFYNKLIISGKTPWQTLGARLFVDVRDNPETKIIKVGSNPAKFFLLSRESELKQSEVEEIDIPIEITMVKKDKINDFHERKLHPLLTYFAYTNTSFNRGRQIYTKTIFHEKSKHSTLSEWVHPGMVGFYSPIEDWNSKLLEFNRSTDKTAIVVYSFEIKKHIDRSNYREYFFQAVSNSSWANEGYLVTCAIQQDDNLLSELERLASSFGIGIIILDLNDIDSSKVLFPAHTKDYLDWETMNKLCEQNTNYETFIDDVQRDYSGRKIHPSEYDSVIKDPEEYIKIIRTEKKV
jgi:hypothetical protein